ncbi:MAG TPA: hypothetical protein VGI60_04750 [Chthoniobacterales bacterium]
MAIPTSKEHSARRRHYLWRRHGRWSTRRAALLAGTNVKRPGVLTLQEMVTLNPSAACKYGLSSDSSIAAESVAGGVTHQPSAFLAVRFQHYRAGCGHGIHSHHQHGSDATQRHLQQPACRRNDRCRTQHLPG